jgi:hypothetical protein
MSLDSPEATQEAHGRRRDVDGGCYETEVAMNRIWPWVAGLVITLLLILLITNGGATRQARYRAMGAKGHQTPVMLNDAAAQKLFMLHMLAVRGRK